MQNALIAVFVARVAIIGCKQNVANEKVERKKSLIITRWKKKAHQ